MKGHYELFKVFMLDSKYCFPFITDSNLQLIKGVVEIELGVDFAFLMQLRRCEIKSKGYKFLMVISLSFR